MENCFAKTLKDEMSDTSVERFDIISFESIAGTYPNLTDDFRVENAVANGVVMMSDDSDPMVFVNSQGATQGTTPYKVPAIGDYIYLRPARAGRFYLEGKHNLTKFRIGQADGHVQFADESKNIEVLRNIPFEDIRIKNQDGLYGRIDEIHTNYLFLTDNTNLSISGDFYQFLIINGAELTYAAITDSCDIVSSKSLTEAFDKIAETRHSGTIKVSVNNIVGIISGEVANLKRCTVNFTSDTTTYPRGWYRTDF